MSEVADIGERVAAYCRRRQLERLGPLGSGMHGNVFRAGSAAAAGEVALKVHLRRGPFELELETYLRLQDENIAQVLGFNVAQLLDEVFAEGGRLNSRPDRLPGAYSF